LAVLEAVDLVGGVDVLLAVAVEPQIHPGVGVEAGRREVLAGVNPSERAGEPRRVVEVSVAVRVEIRLPEEFVDDDGAVSFDALAVGGAVEIGGRAIDVRVSGGADKNIGTLVGIANGLPAERIRTFALVLTREFLAE
jgi:hypothetical protein